MLDEVLDLDAEYFCWPIQAIVWGRVASASPLGSEVSSAKATRLGAQTQRRQEAQSQCS
jgi:hypothetical protein